MAALVAFYHFNSLTFKGEKCNGRCIEYHRDYIYLKANPEVIAINTDCHFLSNKMIFTILHNICYFCF